MVTSLAESFSGLQDRIRARLPTMAEAEGRVCRVLLAGANDASRMTVSELAAAANVSESTVVRTSRTLGFPGYPELRLALAAAAALGDAPASGDDVIAGDISPDDSLDAAVTKLSALETRAVAATAANMTEKALAPIVAALAQARTIEIYGVGVSGFVAEDFGYKLLRLGIRNHVRLDRHHSMTSAPLLAKGDVVVGISHSGETEDVVQPCALAAGNGATVIAITGFPRSKLAHVATYTLVSASYEEALRPGALAGRTGQQFVCDCVFVGLAQQNHPSSMASLALTRVDQSHRSATSRRSPSASPIVGEVQRSAQPSGRDLA